MSGGGAHGKLIGGTFEREKGARRGHKGVLAARRRGLRTDAEELAVLGEASVGRIEDQIELVGTR